MANPNAGLLSDAFSLAAFRRFESDPKKLAQFAALIPSSYYWTAYHFQEATMNADWVASSNGTSPTDFAAAARRNGGITGATGTTANNSTAVHYAQAIFDAADNPFFLVKFTMPAAVTALRMEWGFTDPKTNEYAQTVTDVDTPTVANGVTDGALIAWDLAQTLKTPALVGVGTSTTAAATTILNGAGTAWSPTASAVVTAMVHVRAGISYGFVYQAGAPIGAFSVASGPDTGVLMRPSFYVETTNTTTKSVTLLSAIVGAEYNE